MKTDVLIIGGGAVGAAVAYRLAAYDLRVAVADKELDVCMGTSGHNSAVVHAGFNNRTGSLMAELCVAGNAGFKALAKRLDVPYVRTGKLVVGFSESDRDLLERLVLTGERNGCAGLSMLDEAGVSAREPGVPASCAMLSPNTAIINPFLYNIHLAECAAKNGVRFLLGAEVTAITRRGGAFYVSAGTETVECALIVNAAGLFSDRVAAMAGDASYQLYPARGEYYLFDKLPPGALRMPVYPVPRPGVGGLGVHLTPTIDGNLIIGPSAEYVEEREALQTTAPVLSELVAEAKALYPGLDLRSVIGAYAGMRAKLVPKGEANYGDFVIEESKKTEKLINLVGIESPGLTASMPIAERVAAMVERALRPGANAAYEPSYQGIPCFAEADDAERARLIALDPDYGDIVCRCETVTRAEIRRAMDNPIGARGLIAVKNRVRATMGRCNGGYCFTRMVNMLEKERGVAATDIALKHAGDRPLAGRLK